MANLRDPAHYRQEAALFRDLAAAATDRRDSYLALSIEYERLAQILEKSAVAAALAAASGEMPRLSRNR